MRIGIGRGLIIVGLMTVSAYGAESVPETPAKGEVPKVVHDWPEYRGPNGQFAGANKVALADSMTAMTLVWESEEKGIGFGKSHSGYGRDISYGGDLGPSGIGSPIVAGGLVILSYVMPSGEVIDETMKSYNKPEVWEKHKWKCKVSADDVVIGMDAATGKTRGVSLTDGKTLWELPGHPGLLAYATLEGRRCLVNAGICIEPKSGEVLWQRQAEQTYNGPPVMAGDTLIGYVPHPKSDPPGAMGIVAGFKVDLKGAAKIWTLDERFRRGIISDAGGFRFFVVRDGLLYNVTPSSDTPGKKGTGSGVVQIVRPSDGAILASQPAEGLALPFLWGDRLVLAGDISHRPRAANPEYWQGYLTLSIERK